jgi:hypothetical protein
MSTTMLESAVPSTHAERRPTWPAWTREPLLHFFLLGAALFAVDAILVGEDDPHVIIVDAEVDAEAIRVFESARGRAPNEEELFALRRVWLDNEVLYREGLALGLDKGDKAMRERVIFKALSVVDAGVKRPPVDESVLREWFEKNRVKYDEPARFDFEEAVLSGERDESTVRAFAAALNAGDPGETQAGLRVFTGRPHSNIVQSYGATFAAELEAAPPGEWRALPSLEGLRVMRLKSMTPAKPAKFEDLGGVILQDWTDAAMAEQRSEAVRVLAKKYTVKVENSK